MLGGRPSSVFENTILEAKNDTPQITKYSSHTNAQKDCY